MADHSPLLRVVDDADRPRPAREPLWRHVLGHQLRGRRHARGERLGDTARRAGVSAQYLSEVERGVKEPSSEIIAAVAGALETTLLDLTMEVAESLRTARERPSRPGAGGSRPVASSAVALLAA